MSGTSEVASRMSFVALGVTLEMAVGTAPPASAPIIRESASSPPSFAPTSAPTPEEAPIAAFVPRLPAPGTIIEASVLAPTFPICCPSSVCGFVGVKPSCIAFRTLSGNMFQPSCSGIICGGGKVLSSCGTLASFGSAFPCCRFASVISITAFGANKAPPRRVVSATARASCGRETPLAAACSCAAKAS